MSSFITLRYTLLVSDTADCSAMLALCYKTNKYNFKDVKTGLDSLHILRKSISLANGKHGEWQSHFPEFKFLGTELLYIYNFAFLQTSKGRRKERKKEGREEKYESFF